MAITTDREITKIQTETAAKGARPALPLKMTYYMTILTV